MLLGKGFRLQQLRVGVYLQHVSLCHRQRLRGLRLRRARRRELYGGALFAWAAVPPVDPFNTRIAGGTPLSALGGTPGRYYGTELNLGARCKWLLKPDRAAAHTELTLGLEGALLAPGDAVVGLRGGDTGTLFAVHGSALYRF